MTGRRARGRPTHPLVEGLRGVAVLAAVAVALTVTAVVAAAVLAAVFG